MGFSWSIDSYINYSICGASMTHNLLRCELWLDTLQWRLDECIEVFRYGVPYEMLEKLLLSIFFVMRECQ